MNFLTEEHFNGAMQSPVIAAEITRMLSDDLAICIAILCGPNANTNTHRQAIARIAQELEDGANIAQRRIDAHLNGKDVSMFIPSGPRLILPS